MKAETGLDLGGSLLVHHNQPANDAHRRLVVSDALRGCFATAHKLSWESGIICASISCLVLAFSGLQVKLTGGRVPVLQICIIRSVLSFGTSIASGHAAGIKPMFGHTKHFPLLFLRGFLGTLGITTSYISLLTLPLGDAVTIAQMRPPVTAVMARLLLGEQLGVQGALGCLVSVVGVIILVHPPFLMGGHAEWSQKRLLGTLCSVSSTLFASGTSYAIRKIGKKEPALTVALWFHTTTVCLMIWPLLAGIPQSAKPLAWRDCLLLLGIAATSFLAQLLMTRSYQLLAAARAAAVSFMGVIYSHILGAVIFHERVTASTAGGGVLIFFGVILVTLRSDSSTAVGGNSSSSSSYETTQTAEQLYEPSRQQAAAAAVLESSSSSSDLLAVTRQTSSLRTGQQASTAVAAAAGFKPGLQWPAWLQRLLYSSRHTANRDSIASSKVAYQRTVSQELSWLEGGESQPVDASVHLQAPAGPGDYTHYDLK